MVAEVAGDCEPRKKHTECEISRYASHFHRPDDRLLHDAHSCSYRPSNADHGNGLKDCAERFFTRTA